MTDVYKTETRTDGDHTYRIEWCYDTCHGYPWENSDYHGEVSDWERRDKKPGERVLNEDRGSKRFYDVQATMLKARTVWGITSGKDAAEAVERDFQYLRAWCNDEWHYCGIVVTLLDTDGEPTDVQASLWGIESDCDGYHETVIHDLMGECVCDMNRHTYPVNTLGV